MINNDKSKVIERAVHTANKAHSGQTRKGSETEYVLHVLEAGNIAHSVLTQLFRVDNEVVAASILHDTLEAQAPQISVIHRHLYHKRLFAALCRLFSVY